MEGEIIGRREELLALEAFLGAVPAGGQALLLEGDAGIGKSALWYEGLRLARERSFGVLTARAARAETQIAFATVGDLLAPVLEATCRFNGARSRSHCSCGSRMDGPQTRACSGSRSSRSCVRSLRTGRFLSRSTTCNGPIPVPRRF